MRSDHTIQECYIIGLLAQGEIGLAARESGCEHQVRNYNPDQTHSPMDSLFDVGLSSLLLPLLAQHISPLRG